MCGICFNHGTNCMVCILSLVTPISVIRTLVSLLVLSSQMHASEFATAPSCAHACAALALHPCLPQRCRSLKQPHANSSQAKRLNTSWFGFVSGEDVAKQTVGRTKLRTMKRVDARRGGGKRLESSPPVVYACSKSVSCIAWIVSFH